MTSIAFDQAADFYDRTRGLPPDAMREVVDILGAELRGRGRCLEIGIGTGRIAVPLAEAGFSVAGIDLSAPMLAKLAEKDATIPAMLGDATTLPFRKDAFGAGVVCHVLHLMSGWRDALRELVRVVFPGGVLLIDIGYPGRSPFADLEERVREIAGEDARRPGCTDPELLDETMTRLGASPRLLREIRRPGRKTMEAWFRQIENNIYAWTWRVPEAVRLKACAEVRAWAEEHFGPLDRPIDYERTIAWRAYDIPGGRESRR